MDAAASLNKVKSHQTLTFSISGTHLQEPQLNQTQSKVNNPLSPFHGTDDIQYLMYKKSSQSPRKNRQPKESLPVTSESLQNHLQVTTQPSSDQNTAGGNASMTQRETLSHSGQRIMSMTSKKKKSKGGRRKRKHANNRDTTTSEEELDEQKNIVRELIDEEGSVRNLELEPQPLVENTRNMNGWNATSERSLSLPKIGRQQQQQFVNSKKVNQQLNNSMVSINSPYAVPQTLSQHVFSKQRASQQLKPLESSQVFMHVRKTEDTYERKPPVSLKIRQPAANEEEEDLYDDEIVEPTRKKKSKPEILTGWNNNRHPIFLNQSQSDAQMKQITNRKKSIKTQRNPMEERKIMEQKREKSNLNAVSVKNIEMPALFSYKDVKPTVHQLISQIKKNNISKKFVLVGLPQNQQQEYSEDPGTSQESRHKQEPMIVMQTQGQGGSTSDACEKYLHRNVSPPQIEQSSSSDRYGNTVGSQFGNNNQSMLFSDFDARRDSIMNTTLMNNYQPQPLQQSPLNPMGMSSKHFGPLPFLNTKKERRDFVPHLRDSQSSRQQSPLYDVDMIKKQVILQLQKQQNKKQQANGNSPSQKFLKVSEFPLDISLPEDHSNNSQVGQLKGTNINLNEKVINRQLNKRYSRNAANEIKGISTNSKDSQKGVSYCIYPMNNVNHTQRRIVFQTTQNIEEEPEETPSFMFNSFQNVQQQLSTRRKKSTNPQEPQAHQLQIKDNPVITLNKTPQKARQAALQSIVKAKLNFQHHNKPPSLNTSIHDSQQVISIERLKSTRNQNNESIHPFIKVQLNPSLSPTQEKGKGNDGTLQKQVKKGLELFRTIMNSDSGGQNKSQKTTLENVIKSDEYNLQKPLLQKRQGENEEVLAISLMTSQIRQNQHPVMSAKSNDMKIEDTYYSRRLASISPNTKYNQKSLESLQIKLNNTETTQENQDQLLSPKNRLLQPLIGIKRTKKPNEND